MSDPVINVVTDVNAVLDGDETALNAQQTDLQTQIDALNAQIAALQAQVVALQAQKDGNAESLFQIGLFRNFVSSVSSGQAAGSVLAPAAPPPVVAPTPVTPGITTSGG